MFLPSSVFPLLARFLFLSVIRGQFSTRVITQCHKEHFAVYRSWRNALSLRIAGEQTFVDSEFLGTVFLTSTVNYCFLCPSRQEVFHCPCDGLSELKRCHLPPSTFHNVCFHKNLRSSYKLSSEYLSDYLPRVQAYYFDVGPSSPDLSRFHPS